MLHRRVVLGSALLVSLATPACSALVTPDPSRLDDPTGRDAAGIDASGIDAPAADAPAADAPAADGGAIDVGPARDGGTDAGPVLLDAPVASDAPAADAGTDAGPPPFDAGTDAGPPPFDAGTDAGPPPCTEGTASCAGEVRRVCTGGVVVEEDCAASRSYCEAGTCRPWACEPGSVTCSADFRGVVRCDARGTAATTEACAAFCDPSTAACGTIPTSCTMLPTIAVGGAARFSLCTVADGDTYTPIGECSAGLRANVGDRTYQFRLETARTVTFDLRDFDSGAAIDTVVYLRRVCDDQTTQLGCDDDVPCAESDIGFGCSGGVQVRQSRLTLPLEPGVYYVVADAFDYDTFACGTVELRVY